ncbi:MAG: hypothetical protein NEA02_00695, partial [Thermoanaerobaculia bacterium]|nr:hypothetical protein [Thermoanaerobaculia bacterium]
MRPHSLPRFFIVFVVAASVALPFTGFGADYSTYIQLTGPADKARVTYEKTDEKVTLAFRMDLQTIAALSSAAGQLGICGTGVQFFVACKGAGCKAGDAAAILVKPPDSQHTYDFRVSQLLALTTGGAGDHTFNWAAEAMMLSGNSPTCLTMPIAMASRDFTLVKAVPTPTPTPPPDLALSLDIDNPAVWPKKLLLTDRGGPTKPTFLSVSYQTLSATDAIVKKYCAPLNEQKTHTIVEMKHGDSRSFDVPALPPSDAQKQFALKLQSPPTPT